jgi:hypothetical protein
MVDPKSLDSMRLRRKTSAEMCLEELEHESSTKEKPLVIQFTETPQCRESEVGRKRVRKGVNLA